MTTSTTAQLRRVGACTLCTTTQKILDPVAICERAQQQRFRTIENAASEETSVGWTTVADPSGGSFDAQDVSVGGHAAWLRVRIDRKRLPAKWVEQHVAAAARAKGRNLNARERRELKRDLADKLLPRVLPTTSYVDVLLLQGGEVLVLSASKSALETVQKLWHETFGGELVRQTPSVVAGARGHKLAPHVFAGKRQRVIPGVGEADWLGCEFLAWLWWRSDTDKGLLLMKSFKAGVSLLVEDLAEWRDEGPAVVLRGAHVGAEPEARTALGRGRVPTRLRLQLVTGSGLGAQHYLAAIDGTTLSLSGVALPPDPDDVDDAEGRNGHRLECWAEAARLVRMLFLEFLAGRATKDWPKKEGARIGAWMRR